MSAPYALLPRIIRWFRRFRQRRGYGVHSPIAFEWITDVVYNQSAQYYAYASLSQQHHNWQGLLSEKDARLLFRIANHLRANRILVVENSTDSASSSLAREKAYLLAARPSATLITTTAAEAHHHLDKADFVLWAADECPSFSEVSLASAPSNGLLPQATFVVLFPYATPARKKVWEALQTWEASTLTFDLHRFGVAFHCPRLHRQHYVVNYF